MSKMDRESTEASLLCHVHIPSTDEIRLSANVDSPLCQDRSHLGCEKFIPWENNSSYNFETNQKERAANLIKHTWLSSKDRQIFKMLKHAVCAAENCMTEIFLRKISPREADLLQDPAFPARVRLRFGGSTFPPMIFFKIFHQHNGPWVKYISGKRMIKASSEATEDSLKMMGNRIFFENILHDAMQESTNRITDELNVITLKDYMQYLANLDETPAKFGGKSNFWRLLTLADVPRYTIFYDIVQFLYSGKVSRQLQQQIPSLLVKPVTAEIQMQHFKIISALRCSSQVYNHRVPRKLSFDSCDTKRRSKQAIKRVSRMKEVYRNREILSGKTDGMQYRYESQLSTDLPVKPFLETSYTLTSDKTHHLCSVPSPADELGMNEFDKEVHKLYQWSQELSLENLISTPQLPT